ncbi:MAG: ArnT family glycosyltransferase, partial [Patescibacteria group bacterium]
LMINGLWLIILLATLLRLWNLGTIPPHLTPDEASLGYNAYSILKTGRDEYGELFPIIFKSFGNYKPGLYIYLTVPFVALLGLNEFAVRLPSALAGVLAVWMIYLIVRELFGRGITRKLTRSNAEHLGLVAAFLLAINPWHVLFSRAAWEVNVALTLTLAGIYFFLRSLRENKHLILSAIFFALTYVTYQGAKLATTIPIIILAFVYWKQILEIDRKVIAKSVIAGLIVSSPIILSIFSGQAGRLKVYSIFSYPREETPPRSDISYFLFHSEALNYTRSILNRWSNHFSGRFLFFEGDWVNPRHTAPNHGVLLLIDLMLLPIGLIYLVKRKTSKETLFIFLWLILAPLPAILSREQISAARALNLVVPLVMISSLGFVGIINWVRRLNRLRVAGYVLIVSIFSGSLIYFLDSYFIHLPIHNAQDWFYGYKQAGKKVLSIEDNYDRVIFLQSYDQPYIFFLFYGVETGRSSYQPENYQKMAKLRFGNPYDVGLVDELGKIEFREFSWPAASKKGDLIVGNDVSIPAYFADFGFKSVDKIIYPDGIKVAFRIVEKTR